MNLPAKTVLKEFDLTSKTAAFLGLGLFVVIASPNEYLFRIFLVYSLIYWILVIFIFLLVILKKDN